MYGLIIMQQARRIDALEHEVSQLRSMLGNGYEEARREVSKAVA